MTAFNHSSGAVVQPEPGRPPCPRHSHGCRRPAAPSPSVSIKEAAGVGSTQQQCSIYYSKGRVEREARQRQAPWRRGEACRCGRARGEGEVWLVARSVPMRYTVVYRDFSSSPHRDVLQLADVRHRIALLLEQMQPPRLMNRWSPMRPMAASYSYVCDSLIPWLPTRATHASVPFPFSMFVSLFLSHSKVRTSVCTKYVYIRVKSTSDRAVRGA